MFSAKGALVRGAELSPRLYFLQRLNLTASLSVQYIGNSQMQVHESLKSQVPRTLNKCGRLFFVYIRICRNDIKDNVVGP